MARIPSDAWIALGLLAVCGLFLSELWNSPASGAFITTTTLPIALIFVLTGLSTLMLATALMRRPVDRGRDRAQGGQGGWRVLAMVVWIALYITALPWVGYLLASGMFLIGAGLLYGNRNWIAILASAVALPVLLLLFFERVMIVLLPSMRLME